MSDDDTTQEDVNDDVSSEDETVEETHIVDHEGNRVPLSEHLPKYVDKSHIITPDGKRVLRRNYKEDEGDE